MPFRFERLELPGAVLIRPKAFEDDRGFFMETFKLSDFFAEGIVKTFVQENHSLSRRNVIRGLHYQHGVKAQAKLVQVVRGEILDVIVDIDRASATFGKWLGVSLSSQNQALLYVPERFAHGFCVLSEEAYVAYKVTAEYAPEHEAGIAWDDPDLDIDWPVSDPVLSMKDRSWPPLKSANIAFEMEQTPNTSRWCHG